MGTMALGQTNFGYVRKEISESHERTWQRVILLFVLAYEAAGCLVGGSFLMMTPDGSSMDMPVRIMRGAFPDFFIPGMILFAMGIITSFAFISVLQRWPSCWLHANIALWGLAIWFIVEIAILRQVHWLHFMWGVPVLLGGIMTIPMIERETFRKILLACGIASSLLYAAVNVIVAAAWPGYSSSSMVVSELSAVGAPTRALWMILCTPYSVLMLAFAWGIGLSAFGNRKLKIASILLFVYAASGLLWPFAPMHLREALAAGQGDIRDTMHLALAAITQTIYLCVLGFTAAALGKGFRGYSIATLLLLTFFGVLTFLEAPNVSQNLPTPTIGIWERINIGVFLLWVIVLANVLWRRSKNFLPS